MSAEKLHTFNESFEKYLGKEMQYKSCRLLNKAGTVLISYNQPKSKVTGEQQLKNIARKLKGSPDGIYTVQCHHTYNNAVPPDNYFIKKGNVTLNEGEEMVIPVKNKVEVETTREKTETGVLSLNSALTRIEEVANLRSEVAILKRENEALKKEIEELEAELEEQETMEEGETGIASLFSKPDSPLKSLADLIPSLADEYFKTRNRELDLREKSFNAKKHTATTNKKRSFADIRKEKQNTEGQINLADANTVDKYFEICENMDEAQFAEEVARVKEAQPNLFTMLREEFSLDEDGNPEEAAA